MSEPLPYELLSALGNCPAKTIAIDRNAATERMAPIHAQLTAAVQLAKASGRVRAALTLAKATPDLPSQRKKRGAMNATARIADNLVSGRRNRLSIPQWSYLARKSAGPNNV